MDAVWEEEPAKGNGEGQQEGLQSRTADSPGPGARAPTAVCPVDQRASLMKEMARQGEVN